MIAPEVRAKYQATIGIECHVQLKTATKLFSAAGNDAREAPPNTLVNHIDFGLPGALPVLNKEAVHLAARAAFALNTEPQRYSYFERKHYFYPDLPMGYQISQLAQPIVVGGQVVITVDGQPKTIRINRVQIEADAGKSTHPAGKDYSLVDLNRAGTPLLEIVSEPDISSSAEARAYTRELYLLAKYADISDANLYYGNMRFDVNVSVSQTAELGTRTETKNLNSFRIVEKTVDYEIDRQIGRLEKGEVIVQETRGWDDAKQKTFTMRTKENADDYRYMPDPDIPPVVLDEDYVASVKAEMPVMPDEWRKKLTSLGYDSAQIETLLDIHADIPEQGYLPFIEKRIKEPDFAKFVANIIVNVYEPFRTGDAPSGHRSINPIWQLVLPAVYELVEGGKLSSTKYKELVLHLNEVNEPDIQAFLNSPESYSEKRGFIQVSDEGEIAKIVAQVLADNPKAAEDVKNGEMKAIGFLVGQVMKASRGQANPQLAQELIKKQLS